VRRLAGTLAWQPVAGGWVAKQPALRQHVVARIQRTTAGGRTGSGQATSTYASRSGQAASPPCMLCPGPSARLPAAAMAD
jgi:hypothetical protein